MAQSLPGSLSALSSSQEARMLEHRSHDWVFLAGARLTAVYISPS